MISRTSDWESRQPSISGKQSVAIREPRRPQLTREERVKITFAVRLINLAAKYQGGK